MTLQTKYTNKRIICFFVIRIIVRLYGKFSENIILKVANTKTKIIYSILLYIFIFKHPE